MKQTDWTDRLRKRMERQEEPVGDELWAGIEQALDDRSAAVAARRLALRRWRPQPSSWRWQGAAFSGSVATRS